jgi:hypothetical protein
VEIWKRIKACLVRSQDLVVVKLVVKLDFCTSKASKACLVRSQGADVVDA